MSEGDFFRYLISELERLDVPYMVSGSVASSYHGEPRTSLDIDVVVNGTINQIEAVCQSLAPRCYVSEEAMRQAVRTRGMFNVIDHQSGIKADLIIRKDRPFSIAEFDRRKRGTISGVTAFVVSAEDSILSKLEWAAMGQSERQYHDALLIAKGHHKYQLDIDYLRHWARELRISDSVERLLREAQSE